MYNGNDYYTVFRWFKDELGLNKTERDIYAVIYGYSKNGQNTYNSTAKYLADITDTSRSTVMRVLKDLEKREYIQKINNKINNQNRPEYRVINVDELRMKGKKAEFEVKMLSKDECKGIYENIDKNNNRMNENEKINFIISLYNLKYTEYEPYKINANEYDEFKKVVEKHSLSTIIKKMITHLGNEKTLRYKNTCQLLFVIKNIDKIRIKKGLMLGRLYFKEDFEEIEKNFFV